MVRGADDVLATAAPMPAAKDGVGTAVAVVVVLPAGLIIGSLSLGDDNDDVEDDNDDIRTTQHRPIRGPVCTTSRPARSAASDRTSYRHPRHLRTPPGREKPVFST